MKTRLLIASLILFCAVTFTGAQVNPPLTPEQAMAKIQERQKARDAERSKLVTIYKR